MELDWEKFQSAYQKADEGVKDIVDSGVIGDCVQKAFDAGTINPELQSRFVLGISHLILKTVTLEEIAENLSSLGTPEAKNTLHNILTCINERSRKEVLAIENAPATLASDIAEIEAALHAVPAIRTLANDIVHSQKKQEEAVYSTTQEAILRERKRNDSPRWESEN